MTQSLPAAAIRAEPDAFDISRPRLMGRHAAGNGFLRAALAARGDDAVWGYAADAVSRQGFAKIVEALDPEARVELVGGDELSRLSTPGALYLGDATLATFARLRLRAGVGAFSICGVTHTTATDSAMDAICDLLCAPVAPWDALICTSTAVVETVRRLHEAQADYLRWRLGEAVRIEGCELPMIPLGVYCDDFQVGEAERAAARGALGLEPDEVVGLYVGRLLFHGKAHPAAMYHALQAAAERTGKRLALIQCGWTPNDAIARAFERGAADFAPSVRTLFVDGRDPDVRRRAWASGDIFFSLVDNIQETFGLTPVEAMAAGLPVVVSDYDGYRDTVRHGVDGIRIPTWAPAAGSGQALARAFEAGTLTYDRYIWATGAATAVEVPRLTEAVVRLVQSPDLRRQMGEAGRRRARELYDWPVIYRQYQALWAELGRRRAAAAADPEAARRWAAAPRQAPGRLDPFAAFGHYPTHRIGSDTRLRRSARATAAQLATYCDHTLFSEMSMPRELLARVLEACDPAQALSLAEVSQRLGVSQAPVARAAGILVKMGLLEAVARG